MSSWKPTSYKTRNWRDYNIALKQRGSLTIWFDPDMAWEANPTGKRGRQNTYYPETLARAQGCHMDGTERLVQTRKRRP